MRWWACCVVVLFACGRRNFNVDGESELDFDGDELADTVDNCPAHFNQTQGDDDADDVGDACDPHLGAAGDRLISASYFSRGFGDWTPDALQNWSPGTEGVATTPPPDSTDVSLTFTSTAVRPTISIALVIEDYGPALASPQNVSATIAHPGATVTCTAASAPSRLIYHVQLATTYGGSSTANLPGDVVVGEVTPLFVTAEPAVARCVVGPAITQVVGAAGATPSLFSLTVRGLRARLLYALVYDVP